MLIDERKGIILKYQKTKKPFTDLITKEWLECFYDSKAKGEDLSKSIFWRLAITILPEGVDGENEEVNKAVAEIEESINKTRGLRNG